VRIIAGEWRGRTLTAPGGDATRPTADRTRETLFSMLASRLGSFEGLTVGDFFAGSGALGLEALSRGAATCVFVEQDAPAIRALRANIAALRAQGRCDVRAASVLSLGIARKHGTGQNRGPAQNYNGGPLDLLLMDPPYGTGAGAVALDKLARLGWIAPSSWISIETGREESVSVRGFAIDATRDVGRARIHLLRLETGAG
jgi:16S rRNA (guanine966-N2)-methyltransferase